jgi:glucokinase
MDSATPPATLARPWLVADIGGTNARFGLVTTPGGPALHVQRLAVADHADPGSAIRAYLAGVAGADAGGLASGGWRRPRWRWPRPSPGTR